MGWSSAYNGVGVEGFASGLVGRGVEGQATGQAGTGGSFLGSGGAQGLAVIADSCCDNNQPDDYVASLRNNSSGADPDILALQLNHSANLMVNYIGFFDRTAAGSLRRIGEIQADGAAGIHYKGSHLTLSPTDSPLACSAGRATHAGRIYFDDSLNEPCYCDGSSWQQMDGGGTC